ncbi:hypothetical protein HBB16_01970 [Pseudonocardia sp. MCCB 268]|nr:hypothetical protein [Pseudonocardia cytotoxica]
MAGSLAAQIVQLEEFGALQRRFTSDVSHELRTLADHRPDGCRRAVRVLDELLPVSRRSPSRWSPSWTYSRRRFADLRSPARRRVAELGASRSPGSGRGGTARGGHCPRPGGGRRPSSCSTCPPTSTSRPIRAGSSGSPEPGGETRLTTVRDGHGVVTMAGDLASAGRSYATTVSGCGSARPTSCSTGSGGPRSPGRGAAAAPASACRSASRTLWLHGEAGCRPGANLATGRRSADASRQVGGHISVSPLPLGPPAGEDDLR